MNEDMSSLSALEFGYFNPKSPDVWLMEVPNLEIYFVASFPEQDSVASFS